MQTTSLTLICSLVNVHSIYPRDKMMVIPIPSFADDHNTYCPKGVGTYPPTANNTKVRWYPP